MQRGHLNPSFGGIFQLAFRKRQCSNETLCSEYQYHGWGDPNKGWGSWTQTTYSVPGSSRIDLWQSKAMNFPTAVPMDFEIEPVQVHLERLAQIKRALLAEKPQERPANPTLPSAIPSGSPLANPVKSKGTSRPRPSTPVEEDELSSSSNRNDAQQIVRNWYKTAQAHKAEQLAESK
jgi:hypothetical protein